VSRKLDLKAREYTIEDILFSNLRFKIPRYQRPYSWGTDHVTDFWNDLIGQDEFYFIGSFILNFESFKESGAVEVIDGQQRLLTITIFISVLRDLARELGAKDMAELYQRQCIIFEDKRGKQAPRIGCGDSTNEFFRRYIQDQNDDIKESEPATDEEDKIKRNYIFFRDRVLSELDKFSEKSKKLDYLQELRETIGNLEAIDISVNSEEDAYQIFETTNARNLQLSVADLLKNLFFQKIREKDGKDVAKERWTEIVNNIEETDTDLKRFLRYFWISKYKFVTEKQLFKAVKREITKWDDFLVDLCNASMDYNRIIEGGEDDWSDIKNGNRIYKSLSALGFMRVTQCNVFLLSLFRNLKKLGTDPTKTIELIERFSFNYSAVCGLPTNRVERIYSKYAIDIEKAVHESIPKKISGNVQRVLVEFEKELAGLNPSFETFDEYFDEVSYKNSDQSRQLVKYILSEINSLDEGGEHKIDFSNVNIEHILPLNPNRDWGLSKKEIKEYVNKIGNLTLIHKKLNSAVGNRPIKYKIKVLRESKIPMTKKLVKKLEKLDYEWGETEISKRQKELADIAYHKVWVVE
jgi:uncharacterized protein with ParB-like and HNH nuclease domain